MLDVEALRAETPGCAEVLHFNNAGAALMPRSVVAAVTDHLRLEMTIGGYEAERQAANRLAGTRAAIARLLHGKPTEVALVENATRAWDMAVYGLRLVPGDRILTGRAEYESNLIALLQIAERTGATLAVVPDDEAGQIDVAALEAAIDDRARLIALTHVPTNNGLVSPAAAVGRVARAAGVPYVLDACQSAGQMPLDVGALGCDVLCGTGRKYLRGPRGTGFLWVREAAFAVFEPAFLDMRAAVRVADDRYELRPDARRYETWESNVAGNIGLGVAVDLALSLGLEAIRARVVGLAGLLRERLAALPGVTLHDRGAERCGIVTFTVAGQTAPAISAALCERKMNTSVSSAGPGDAGPAETVRASLHCYNTEDEVVRFTLAVGELAAS